MFYVITNIYNKKTKEPALFELFTVTGKLKKIFKTQVFDVCTTGDTAHIDTIIKFLPHTRQHGCIDILHCCNEQEKFGVLKKIVIFQFFKLSLKLRVPEAA
jgi:hypothetical protein